MNQVLGQLVYLQELDFIQSGQAKKGDKHARSEIGQEIERILDGLPLEVASLYRSLHKRSGVAVVAERRGHCSACGLGIPTSQLSAILRSSGVQRCQGCRRILYHMGDSPEKLPLMSPKVGVRGIARYSAPDLMCPNLAAETRDQAIEELIGAMARAGWVANESEILAQALDRENQVPTAMGHGLAFPHVRGLDSGGLRLSFGTSEDGVDFGASSVRVICFAVIPTAGNTVYLRLLSELIEVLEQEESRAELLSCSTRERLWGALTKMAGGRPR